MDANLYNTRLAEYPHIPRILRTSPHYPSDTPDIPGLSVDANLYNTPLAEYPRIPWILRTSPDYPWMPTYTIPPWQSIHGFSGYSGHPQIIRGCQPIQYPLGRVLTDSPDIQDIPGLSVDANLYNTPLAEYPRIPRILRTSPDYPWMPTYTIPPCRVSTDFPDTLDIPGLSVDANLYSTPLAEYPWIPRIFRTSLDYLWMPTYTVPPWQSIHGFPGFPGLSVDANLYNTPPPLPAEYPRIPRILWTSPNYPWMPTYIIPPWQSIHRFPGYSGHPRIILGCQPIQYPLGRVSTDFPDTLDIPGLSVDTNLYSTPLAEYPRLPRILRISLDYPWMPIQYPLRRSIHGSSGHPRTIHGCRTYTIPPWQSIHGHPRIIPWMPTYTVPPWQSIHGFPGYSGYPWIIRGCQPIQYPLGRVSTDSPDTPDIPELSVDANLYNTPWAE